MVINCGLVPCSVIQLCPAQMASLSRETTQFILDGEKVDRHHRAGKRDDITNRGGTRNPRQVAPESNSEPTECVKDKVKLLKKPTDGVLLNSFYLETHNVFIKDTVRERRSPGTQLQGCSVEGIVIFSSSSEYGNSSCSNDCDFYSGGTDHQDGTEVMSTSIAATTQRQRP
ncbi:hypothetical protein PHYPSEUDO_013683 [Phytophthora pseudosyringae]|uniref:Uncharacterized protein n=1 Tax=Phytophthora pseudosyringae TaxID=221518 RepID=A0A8T1W6I3_9STRA|nr:hypothetical protein PHYPSEUDO_013683 [Phytophthora pseudosyringae]